MKHVLIFITAGISLVVAQPKIADFTILTTVTQSQNLVLPSTHTFQRLIKTADALTGGGSLPFGNDFTGYVPIGGSSTNG